MTTAVLKRIKHKTRIRTRYRDLKKKSKTVTYIYRTDGLPGISMYIREGTKKRLKKKQRVVATRKAGDVLIVSISDELLDRYRSDHMIESLRSTGTAVDKIFYYELTAEHIKSYNVFIFYRVPWLPPYKDFFADIKRKNKIAIFAVDDLVIDTKYTDKIPAVQQMVPEDRAIYDDGVKRHKKVMEHCDYAITTTEALADELRTYKHFKEVYIDRNSMSQEMIHYADIAINEVRRDEDKIVVGYFSGTNTHNEDFQMIGPALIRVLQDNENVYIKLAGRIDAPEELKDFADRLIYTPYVNWRKLPLELRKCDVVLAPLVNTLFNRAKSEIKWSEAALVGVPVVASDIGAYSETIKDGHTGILVENTTDAWYEGIRSLIDNSDFRQNIAKASKDYVRWNYRTTGERATKLNKFIDDITPNVIAFGGINISAISGGNMVVKRHMDILRTAGNIVYGVESMDYHTKDKWVSQNIEDDKVYDIFRINSTRPSDRVNLAMHFDRYVATFWASVGMVDQYRHMKKNGEKLYLVQNMEADFYPFDDPTRLYVLATYRNYRIKPITISKWCQDWLKDNFDRQAKYAPNGIDLKNFEYNARNWNSRKIRILIEGDSASEYKRVDESFKIANQLDRDKFEVSYLSYNAHPKDWYVVDKVYMQVPHDEVGAVYAACDILIKSSILESFSYPPLEMMATGGFVVVVPNGGNKEYLRNRENCLSYEAGNLDAGVKAIYEIVGNKELRDKLATNGLATAKKYQWKNIEKDILALYS